MKKLAATLITLTAIGVAVKVVGKKSNKKQSSNRVYRGPAEPSIPIKGDIWFKPNGSLTAY